MCLLNIITVSSFGEYWSKLKQMRSAGDEWAIRTHDTLRRMSPLSVRVTWQQLQRGASMSLAECLDMEFTLVQHFLRGHDFYEGVRALLVDKDKKPQWQVRRYCCCCSVVTSNACLFDSRLV